MNALMKPGVEWAEAAELRPLAPGEFAEIRRLARRAFGLDLKPGKEELVAARLRRLARSGGCQSYHELFRRAVEDASGETLAGMIDALATNHTSFLREPDHFAFLRDAVLPALGARGEVEVWSAACSTGEEAWTLAFVLNDAVRGSRIHVTATDISRKALAAAERAVYSSERCAGLPAAWKSRYFELADRTTGACRIRPEIRAQVSFHRLNLAEPFSPARRFPLIFCRNVMIYFDAETQERVAGRLAASLEPGGFLFVGHAENLTRFSPALEYVRPAVYRKAGRREGGWSRSS